MHGGNRKRRWKHLTRLIVIGCSIRSWTTTRWSTLRHGLCHQTSELARSNVLIAYLVVCEILKQAGLALILMIEEDLEYFATTIIVYFLSITRIRDWLLLSCVD